MASISTSCSSTIFARVVSLVCINLRTSGESFRGDVSMDGVGRGEANNFLVGEERRPSRLLYLPDFDLTMGEANTSREGM